MVWPIGAAEPVPKVVIQPLGKCEAAAVAVAKSAVERQFGAKVEVRPALGLPESAFYPPRRRYRAGKLLDWLGRRVRADEALVLGLTAVDISTTKGEVADWGILGLAELGGGPAVVSTFRLRSGDASADLFRARLAKVAVHETGHALGLEHCPDRLCVMQDARGTVATFDRIDGKLCAGCRKLLAAGSDWVADDRVVRPP